MTKEPTPRDDAEDISARGERYLAMIGLEDLAEQPFTHKGVTYPTRDFLRICGAKATPSFIAFEHLEQDDPKREKLKLGLQAMIHYYVGMPNQ